MQKVQEEIHNVNYENILIHLVASNMFVLISMFTKNWGRNWGIFDSNDFLKLFLNKMDFRKVYNQICVLFRSRWKLLNSDGKD